VTLEAMIREAVANGGLRSLTLWTVPNGFQANVSPDGKSWCCMIAADPVEAIRRALDPAPVAAENEDIFG
jgi:hypothetical protein